ncbi:MAG: DUF4139 domain-containing protein [Planctomycetes bacterium]|nr:DUF4139 domain-containing protein [Planctomycetota bacterium]
MKKLIIIFVLLTSAAYAKIDLSTLPTRDTVQLTIYNSADLTLARESRQLTLKKGTNKLQFSWANTLIDPTSLEMIPLKNAGKINIMDLTFPPRVRNLGLWNIESKLTGRVPMEITYLTSGITWKAFYMGTLSKDEKTMQLQGYVRVTNNSGEDYENAQTRLIVGKVNILDQISTLARRQYAYERPDAHHMYAGRRNRILDDRGEALKDTVEELEMVVALESSPKVIKKEGLSEYFLYTIPGTETIPNRWSKRLPSFDTASIPVVNLYKYNEQMYGRSVVRFLSFKNDKKHKLGLTPIPGGAMKVYRDLQENKHLSYTGQSSFKYIPVKEKVELNLGAVQNVVVKPTMMNRITKDYRYNSHRNISGWTEVKTMKLQIKNTRSIPVKIEIKRNFPQYWEIETEEKYEKIDKDTIKFTMTLKPRTEKTFEYELTIYHRDNYKIWKQRNQ